MNLKPMKRPRTKKRMRVSLNCRLMTKKPRWLRRTSFARTGEPPRLRKLDSDDELEDDKDELEELIATADEDEEDWDEMFP